MADETPKAETPKAETPKAEAAAPKATPKAGGVKAPMLGKQAKADLPKALFSEPFHESLVHQAARADLNARRRGTHSSLTRGEVSMTTAKAWRQKGTGRARVGALSVPHRYGGGAAFGPKPRHYTFKINRKARRRALRAALSVHAERGSVAVIDGGAYEKPSTKQAAQALEKWGADAPILIVIGAEEGDVAKSFRNIPRVQVAQATAAGVADVIGAASLVVSEAALAELEGRAAAAPGREAEEVAE
jgi:large subunit ribosomal protein L4